ncbi:putative FAD-binding domain, phenol hydroxylase dimerization domain, Thioredoxin-like superfamily [Septoria linicola]|nr:putative FAD-binding domain, phenol hydroxylase dimerization domain, Thioredoxin-like superfamily [Septoria linicola]
MTTQYGTHYDVLIIGSGPAGLIRGIKICILENKPARLERGQADGFEPRILEVLDSFGLLDTWIRWANRTVDLAVWIANQQKELQRIIRRSNAASGTSRFVDTTMDQAVLERAMEDHLMREYGVSVSSGTESVALDVDTNRPYPVAVKVGESGTARTLHAKYLVGADGAHSWTRKQTEIVMEGSRSSQCWGVADINPLTNFPDIRSRCIVHDRQHGTLMFIPREAGMVRIYVQLGDLAHNNPDYRSEDAASYVLYATQQILSPYRFEFGNCYRSSFYNIQQQLATHFTAFGGRVFLVGDAIHTHSPKAGMGLNVSLQDSYNLGWKLAAVINGEAKPSLLETYESDRRPVAEFLIDFDRNFQQFFHAPLSGKTVDEYRNSIVEATTTEHAELSGISVCYSEPRTRDDSVFVQNDLATGILPGRRIPHGVVTCDVDGQEVDVHQLLQSNGKWRMIVFPGDLQDPAAMQRYAKLADDLSRADSPLNIFAPMASTGAKALEVLTIHSTPRYNVELRELPEVYHPWHAGFGWDYNKVYTDHAMDNASPDAGYLYEKYGVHDHGCVLLLRPDQHVSMIMDIEHASSLCARNLSNWLRLRDGNGFSGDNSIKEGQTVEERPML